jgi:hypothetical protein
MKPRISLFAEREREDRRTKIGDPLVDFNQTCGLRGAGRQHRHRRAEAARAKGGRLPAPTLLMVKILVVS